jgi:hypothetical protein
LVLLAGCFVADLLVVAFGSASWVLVFKALACSCLYSCGSLISCYWLLIVLVHCFPAY